MAAPGIRILDDVRRRCAEVSDGAGLVRVDHESIPAYAERLATEGHGRDVDPPDPWLATGGDPEGRAALVLALDAVNFGSGYHPVVTKRPGMSGAVTMATSLREHAEATADGSGLAADALAGLTAADAHRIFGQPDDDGPVDELMARFATALRDLGRLVAEVYDGRYLALVEDARHSAARLVAILDQLPFFHDVAEWHGLEVPFYKRAQLAAADLDRAFDGTGPGHFDDLAELTAFADNLVPHVLRVDGVLRYDPDLAATNDAGELLEAGSVAETEIRAAGIHAVELLCADLAARGRPTTPHQLDHVLWFRGGAPAYKAVPRHRARSVFY
ncbi:MAG: queuosine salvage family protein [Acidimicrobiales bacterium]